MPKDLLLAWHEADEEVAAEVREALEAEARDDAARAERLATPYAVATPRIGTQSESDPYRLSGVEASAVAAFSASVAAAAPPARSFRSTSSSPVDSSSTIIRSSKSKTSRTGFDFAFAWA